MHESNDLFVRRSVFLRPLAPSLPHRGGPLFRLVRTTVDEIPPASGGIISPSVGEGGEGETQSVGSIRNLCSAINQCNERTRSIGVRAYRPSLSPSLSPSFSAGRSMKQGNAVLIPSSLSSTLLSLLYVQDLVVFYMIYVAFLDWEFRPRALVYLSFAWKLVFF